jgi:radical SAM-linked protein
MIPDNIPIKQRLHITFGKFDTLRYTSNLDIAKLWERVLRRANLPILYSEGFNPRPRIALASALPLGYTSECEIIDISLRETIPLDGVRERLQAASPPGLRLYQIVEVPVRHPALQALVRSAEYRIHFEDDFDRDLLEARIRDFLAADQIHTRRERKGRSLDIDLRPLVYDLRLTPENDLIAHLAVGDHGNARPDELLAELGFGEACVTIHRFQLHLAPPD